MVTCRFEPSAIGPNGTPISQNVKITKEEAAKIITVLAKDNFFRESVEDEKKLARPKSAHYEIWVSYQKEGPAAPVQRWRTLRWSLHTVQHLEAIQACVAGDPKNNTAIILLNELLRMPKSQLPLTYRSEKTGFIFYVESDRQHMSAMNKELKLLWHMNVILGAESEGPRPPVGATTRIVSLGEAPDSMLTVMKEHGKSGEYIQIMLDSLPGACGLLDQNSGEFTYMGNN